MYDAWMRECDRLDVVLTPRYGGKLGKFLFWASVLVHDWYYKYARFNSKF